MLTCHSLSGNALIKTASALGLGLMLSFTTAAHAEITARMGTSLPDSHPQTLGAKKFAELVEEKSQGEITVKVFKVDGEINTDDFSPGNQAQSRADIPLHAKFFGVKRFPEGIATIGDFRSKGHKVAFAGEQGIYGNTVILDHGFGLFTLYAHLSRISVVQGQMVDKEEIIGQTGLTGMAGGDHLHYGTLIHQTYVNPVEWWDDEWIKNNISAKINDAGPR